MDKQNYHSLMDFFDFLKLLLIIINTTLLLILLINLFSLKPIFEEYELFYLSAINKFWSTNQFYELNYLPSFFLLTFFL